MILTLSSPERFDGSPRRLLDRIVVVPSRILDGLEPTHLKELLDRHHLHMSAGSRSSLRTVSGVDTVKADGERDEAERVEVLTGFRVVHVFALSQSEGDELADVRPRRLTGEVPQQLIDTRTAERRRGLRAATRVNGTVGAQLLRGLRAAPGRAERRPLRGTGGQDADSRARRSGKRRPGGSTRTHPARMPVCESR